jgi:aldehyde dehydrogenase (NAD+)
MADLFKNYIDGQWVEAKSRKTFENRNPANRHDLIGLFPASGPEDVDEAVRAAKKAFASWRLVPAPKRGEILQRVGEVLRKRKEELARGMTREMGKILKETRGDVQEGIDTAFYVAGEGRRLFGATTPSEIADRRLRADHAMELSRGDPDMEAFSRSSLRQHRGAQAG